MQEATKHVRRLVSFIFIAAQITIARYWKSAIIPFGMAKAKLSWIMVNERFSAILNDKMKQFEKIRDPFVSYLSGHA